MKSPTTFFDRGVARNYLRRFWPLWAGYFVLVLLLLPAALPEYPRAGIEGLRPTLDLQVLDNGLLMVGLAFFVGIITAMAMFHYLYQTRSCGMMNSLPLRRETMFFTAYLTGLLPLLLADLLAAGVTAMLFLPRGYLTVWALLRWLALATLGKITFYNFAVFCAMLTGNLIVLPAVYVVLHFTAYVAEGCVRELLKDIVYGMGDAGAYVLSWLSPPVELIKRLRVKNVTQLVDGVMIPEPYAYRVAGFGTLAIYAAVSLLFLAAALWLYRRRQMETATDVVAVPVLKPVFKYCLSFGTAVVSAAVVNNLIFQYDVSGWAQAGILLLLLLIGAFLGYFAAEMLIRKTLQVFRGHWKGYFIVAAVLAVLLVATEADVTGFEKRVPDPAQIRQVDLNRSATLTEPENIAAVTRLHRHLIEEKANLEKAKGAYRVEITYVREDGSLFCRAYDIPMKNDSALVEELMALINSPEAVLGRLEQRMQRYIRSPEEDVDRSLIISGGRISRVRTDEGIHWETEVELSAEQARELYEQAILGDVREARIGRVYLFDEVSTSELSDFVISLDLRENSKKIGDYYADQINLSVEMDAVQTLQYLREQFGLEAVSQAEAGLDDAENVTGGFWWW